MHKVIYGFQHTIHISSNKRNMWINLDKKIVSGQNELTILTKKFSKGVNMAKPRVFISSTYYDLSYVRDDIERFIGSIGYEAVRHEAGAIAYSKGIAVEESVYKEISLCDIIVCIIGGRYGTQSSTRDGSITSNELKQALENGIQVYIFIDRDVMSEYSTYKANRDREGTNYVYIDNVKIYQYLDQIHSLTPSNPICPFKSSIEICNYLTNQWAGLFQRFLLAERRQLEINYLSEMKDLAATLREIVSSYDEESKGKNEAIENLISAVNPAYEAFRRITNTPYRVYFTNLEELNVWLSVRGYRENSIKESFDNDSIYEWLNEKADLYICLKHDIFNKNGNLERMLPNEWNEDWLVMNHLQQPSHEPSEDVPF